MIQDNSLSNSFSDSINYGFFLNPHIQDSQLKAMTRRERFMQGVYEYANSDRDENCKKKSEHIFGKGTIPLHDKEDCAYFLGDAVLKANGYTGLPSEYFLANKLEMPEGVNSESEARIYLGKKFLKESRAVYDKRKEYENLVAKVQQDMPGYLANAVRKGFIGDDNKAKESINTLSEIGMWDKLEKPIERARAAWDAIKYDTGSISMMQDISREQLANVTPFLLDENGKIDELAFEAFVCALNSRAKEIQTDNPILSHASNAVNKFENFLSRTNEQNTKEAYNLGEEILQDLASDDLSMSEHLSANSIANSKYKKKFTPEVERLHAAIQGAMNTAMDAPETAGIIAKIAAETGSILGEGIAPIAAGTAAALATRGAGGGMVAQGIAAWAGGLTVSADATVNAAISEAYLQGLDNPEAYGRAAGLGQAMAENIANVGGSGIALFGGFNRLLTKIGAKAATSKVFSNAAARSILAWGGTTLAEGSTELAEEEIGSFLGATFNGILRSTGTDVSKQEHNWGETIAKMQPHQIAAIYVFAGSLGILGGVANYNQAVKIASQIDTLEAAGLPKDEARKLVAKTIENQADIERVESSSLSTEEKSTQIRKLQDSYLQELGQSFHKNVIEATPEDIAKRSQQNNADFIYNCLLATSIKNQLDEQALSILGYGERQANGKYLLTYEEKGEGENSAPKLVQKEWTREQLTGFLTFQRNTDFHNLIRNLQSSLTAQTFADSVANQKDLMLNMLNLRDLPIESFRSIQQHGAITPEFFKAIADHEAARIAADMAENNITKAQAENAPSDILPNVSRKAVQGIAAAAEERRQQAVAKGEIEEGEAVEYPGLNISQIDGSMLTAFMSGRISASQMLEEVTEARLKMKAGNDKQYWNRIGNVLQEIQKKLPGIKLFPAGKDKFNRNDIVEAYSHLAVAEIITNPAYFAHLNAAEKAVIMDVLTNTKTAIRYKLIGDAWQTYKNSEDGKSYLVNGGKDIRDMLQDAGFTFGKHFSAIQATAEQRIKVIEGRNFLPDFNEEVKLLENKAEAEQELAEVNAKEAQEPTVIPADESVTGEEIVITPEQKEAEQAPAVARPDFVKLVKALGEARYDVTFFKESMASAQKRIEKWRSQGNEKMIEYEEKKIAYDQQKLEELPQKIKDLEEAIANYNTSINAPNAVLTPEEQLLNKLRTPAATIRDFVTFFSKHRTTEANDIELGLHTKTQNGEENPAYVIGKRVGDMVRRGSIVTEEQYSNLFLTERINEEIVKVAGELVSSTVLKQEAAAAKKYAQLLRNTAKRSKGKLTQAQNAGGTLPLPAAPKWPASPKKENKPTEKQIVDILSTTTSKDKGRYVLNHVSQEIQDGTATYVSTDGYRISALSFKTKERDSKILLDPKTAEPAKDQGNYVSWQKVSRFDTPVIKTINLAPMLALTKLRKRGKYKPTLSSDSATHKVVEIDVGDKHYTLNAAYFREAVEQLSALTKAYGFPSTVQVHDADIFVISASHNGLKWQCCIQTLKTEEGVSEHNIVFSETSSFIRGAAERASARKIDDLQKLYEIDEARAKDAETEAAELKQKADDVAILEEQLPAMEKNVRQTAATVRGISYTKVGDIARAFDRGDLSAIMGTIPLQDEKTKWGRDLFERISGLTLPGTPEGNKAMAEQWAAEQAAKGTPFNTSPDSSTSGANFSVIGEHAQTWEKYKPNAFAGRDDGKMRAELDSSQAKIILANYELDKEYKLEEVFSYPELFAAYPQLSEYSFTVKKFKDPGLLGSFFGKNIQVSETLTADKTKLLSTLLHETQHAIQTIEGFAHGGNEITGNILYRETLTGRKFFDLSDDAKMVVFYKNTPEIAELLNSYIKFLKATSKEFSRDTYSSFYVWNNLLNIAHSFKNKIHGFVLNASTYQKTEFEEILRALDKGTDLDLRPGKHFPQEIAKLQQVYETYFNAAKLEFYKKEAKRIEEAANAQSESFKIAVEHNKKVFEKLHNNYIYDNYEYYKRLAGEIEARNVSARMFMSAEERQKTPFNETLEYEHEALLNFSIQSAKLDGERFAGNPLAERMANFMRQEARRYSRSLGKKNTTDDAAVNAMWAAHSIIHTLDKYVRDGKFKMPYNAVLRLNHLRALVDKYAEIMKAGKVRSFNKIDKHEQAELLAAMAEAAAGMEADAINAMTPEEYAAFKAEVEAEMKPELYRKHARALADDVAKGRYSTPTEITKRMKALAQAAKTGFTNQRLTDEDLQESGYNSQPDASTRQTVLKEYAKAKLAELENAEEANRKEFESNKAQTLSALHRIMSEGRIADNTTLGEVEQRQLTELVENEAKNAIEKEARDREFKQTADKMQQEAIERNQRMVRIAATGRIAELLSEMLNEAADITEIYLKADLLKKMERITGPVKIKRAPSKKLKGKMTAAGYRALEQAITLMGMSTRAKQQEQEDIEEAIEYLALNQGKKDIDTLRKHGDILPALAERIEKEGGTVTVESLNNALAMYRASVGVYGDINGKNYKQTLIAANALYSLVTYHRNRWQDILDRRTAEMRAYLNHFMENTQAGSGSDNAQRARKSKDDKWEQFSLNATMNSAQLMLALSSFEPLRPIMDDMRYKLANAMVARNAHIQSMRAQELAFYGKLIGMNPATEAGYSDNQLKELSYKFDLFYQENNQEKDTDITFNTKDGVESKLRATKWEVLDLILAYRQEHYKANAMTHGFTDAVIKKMEEYVGSKLMAFGNFMSRALINDGTIKVYEEREGIPIRENDKYFPVRANINTLNTTREEPLVNPYHPAATHDFLKVRVRHLQEIKAENAYMAYRRAIADRSNYIYLDPVTDNITRLLAHRDFSNRLTTLIGKGLKKQLELTINEIRGAGYQETSLQDMPHKGFGGALSAGTLAALAGNPSSLLRQLSAMANVGLMPGLSKAELAKYSIITLTGKGHITIGQILKLAGFKTRERDNAFINEMAAMENDTKFSRLLNLSKKGMNWMDTLDLCSNAVSAAIVYNSKYEKLKAMGGMPEEQIRKLAEQEVNAYLQLLAQPLNRVDKSAMYWSLSSKAYGRALLYMGSEAINKVGMMRANYIIKRNNGESALKASWNVLARMGLTIGTASAINECVIALLTGNIPDEEDDSVAAWLVAQYLNATIGNFTDALPVLGQFTRYALSPYAWAGDDSFKIPGKDVMERVPKLYTMLTDDKDYSAAEWQKQTTGFLREFTALLGYGGGAHSTWKLYSQTSAFLHSLVTALNLAYPLTTTAANYPELFPDAYAKTDKRTRKRKRSKSTIERILTPTKEKKSKKSK